MHCASALRLSAGESMINKRGESFMLESRPQQHPLLRTLLGLGLGLSLLMHGATATPLRLLDPYDTYGSTVVGAAGVIYNGQGVLYWGPGRLADHQLPVSRFVYGAAMPSNNVPVELTTLSPMPVDASYGRVSVDVEKGSAGVELQRPITVSSGDAASLASLRLASLDLPSGFSLNVNPAPYAFYSARTGITIYSRQAGAQPGDQRQLLGTVIYADDNGYKRWTAERWQWQESSDPALPGHPDIELIGSGVGEFDFGSLAGLASSAVNGRTTDFFYDVFLHLSSWGVCANGNYVCEDERSRGALNAELSFANDSSVPEPGSLSLVATAGMLMLLGLRARRRELQQRS